MFLQRFEEDLSSDNMGILQWLSDWYASQCDGWWEHIYGVKIDTLDNPGWMVNIDIYETEMYDRPFEEIKINNGDDDWMFCRLTNNGMIFDGAGDPSKLEDIL